MTKVYVQKFSLYLFIGFLCINGCFCSGSAEESVPFEHRWAWSPWKGLKNYEYTKGGIKYSMDFSQIHDVMYDQNEAIKEELGGKSKKPAKKNLVFFQLNLVIGLAKGKTKLVKIGPKKEEKKDVTYLFWSGKLINIGDELKKIRKDKMDYIRKLNVVEQCKIVNTEIKKQVQDQKKLVLDELMTNYKKIYLSESKYSKLMSKIAKINDKNILEYENSLEEAFNNCFARGGLVFPELKKIDRFNYLFYPPKDAFDRLKERYKDCYDKSVFKDLLKLDCIDPLKIENFCKARSFFDQYTDSEQKLLLYLQNVMSFLFIIKDQPTIQYYKSTFFHYNDYSSLNKVKKDKNDEASREKAKKSSLTMNSFAEFLDTEKIVELQKTHGDSILGATLNMHNSYNSCFSCAADLAQEFSCGGRFVGNFKTRMREITENPDFFFQLISSCSHVLNEDGSKQYGEDHAKPCKKDATEPSLNDPNTTYYQHYKPLTKKPDNTNDMKTSQGPTALSCARRATH